MVVDNWVRVRVRVRVSMFHENRWRSLKRESCYCLSSLIMEWEKYDRMFQVLKSLIGIDIL